MIETDSGSRHHFSYKTPHYQTLNSFSFSAFCLYHFSMVLVEVIIADLAIDKAMKSAARFRHRLHHFHVCLSGADGIIDIMPAIFKLQSH